MANVNIICWANGLLELSTTVPDGSLPLAEAEISAANDALNALATLSYDGEWLVPKSMGWLEALHGGDTDRAEQEAYNSMMMFRTHLLRALENRQARQGKGHGKE